ncbi:hypothetical protein C7B80_13155 [Cyanosarcina cf. burmensis CCALA 770]|nr:hypothetical protein C7B80_13155 [Cyanosarcina cf. burmensis CCALA 770]
MTDEEIAKWQEELYALECSCTTGPPVTEEEQMRRIREIASGEFQKRMREMREARIRELPQEIANTSAPQQKARLQLDLELLTGKQNEAT